MNPNKSLIYTSNSPVKGNARINDFAEFDNLSDRQVWSNFSTGSSEMLIYIYHKYVAQLLRFGVQFAPREVVKDSIQDLFLYLKERKKQPTEVKNIRAYLYKSLYRILKKKVDYNMKFTSADQFSSPQNWRIAISEEITIIEKETNKEQKEKLKSSLENLSIKQKQALLLYYYEGFTHKEISDIMELKNKSSVRKLIFRAIDSLKESFTK